MNVCIGWVPPLPLRLLLRVRWELGEILPVLLFFYRYIIYECVHRQSSPTATEATLEGSLRVGWNFACATVFLQIYIYECACIGMVLHAATGAAACRLQRINLCTPRGLLQLKVGWSWRREVVANEHFAVQALRLSPISFSREWHSPRLRLTLVWIELCCLPNRCFLVE